MHIGVVFPQVEIGSGETSAARAQGVEGTGCRHALAFEIADSALPTAGTLPPPWRYDDHYGFGTQSCIE